MNSLRLKKVCIVAPGHWSDVMGGAQYQTMLLVQALHRDGDFDVTYVAKHFDPEYVPEDHSIVPLINRWNRTRSTFLDALHLYRILNRLRPEVIYHRGGTAYSGVAAYYAFRRGIRSVWHISSDADVTRFDYRMSRDLPLRMIDRLFVKYCIRRTDTIIAQTSDQATHLQSRYGRQPTAIVGNFHPLPTGPIEKTTPPEVLWVGNFKALKQPEIFIQAAQRLLPQIGARFIMIGALIGSGKWNQSIRRALEKAPNIEFRGACSQEEVNAALSRAAVLVNTSLWEGFPNTFVQAWMRRVSVVSLRVNPNGVFTKHQLGMLSGTVDQLSDDILRLVTDGPLRERMGEAAQRYAYTYHSEANIGHLINLIRGSTGVASKQSGEAPATLEQPACAADARVLE